MKKGFVIYSLVVAVLACWSFLFLAMHWVGGIRLSLLTAVLGIIAAVWGACACMKSCKCCKGLVIYNAIVMILAIAGLWFKIAHWPCGKELCIACFGVLIPIAIVWNAISCAKQKKE